MSVNSTDPSELFGGWWEQLEDRFLLGAGATYAAGETGGSASVAITSAQMPSHSHGYQYSTTGGTSWSTVATIGRTGDAVTGDNRIGFSNSIDKVSSGGYLARIASVGGGEAHNNMPPYLPVYMWKRIDDQEVA